MDDEAGGIVWLIDGKEVVFEPAGEPRRPWLEESSAWGSDAPKAAPSDDDGSDNDPPELIWI